MNPEQPSNPQINPAPPSGFGPVLPPQPSGQTPMIYPPRRRRNKNKTLIIGAAAGVVVLIGIVVAVVLLSGGEKKPPTPQPQPQAAQEDPMEPATSVDTEQANNAISQDITSVNDDKDLPANQLDDKSLGL